MLFAAFGADAVLFPIYIAAVCAWSMATFGATLCNDKVGPTTPIALRTLACASALLAIGPLLPAEAVMALAIGLGMSAIFTALVGIIDLLKSLLAANHELKA